MRNQKQWVFIVSSIFSIFMLSCSGQKSTTMIINKTKDVSTGDGKYIISSPIVLQRFIATNNGKATIQKDFYIQRSIQDYYIKFCESQVSREMLETYLSTQKDIIKTATLEIEYLQGNWDDCDKTITPGSRTGTYVIIHRLITY